VSAFAFVRAAGEADLPELARLFDAYRQFYAQPADRPLARTYLAARLAAREAVILVAPGAAAGAEGNARGAPLAGFTQLYPTWCSVAARPYFILYDLYVEPAARRHGLARALMTAARDHARAHGAQRLTLATARCNAAAQALYESLGYAQEREFVEYALPLDG